MLLQLVGVILLGGVNATIATEQSPFTEAQSGAKWLASTWTGPNAGFAVELENATLTIEGFEHLGCTDGSMIVVGNGSTLHVSDCHFEGTTQADTAAIDTGPMGQSISTATPVSNVGIHVANSSFRGNARGILTRSTRGTTRLDISDSHFVDNSAWPIEYRVGAGDHEMNLADSFLQWSANTPVRLYAFHNQSAALATVYRVNLDRVRFELTDGARAALVLGGVENSSHPDSSWTLRATNSIFDLRGAGAFADTSALNSLPETTRRGSALFEHCTVVIGNAAHSGIVWRGGPANVFTILNSIIDGPGTAITNSGTGSVISGMNLFHTASIIAGSGGATVSGRELVGIPPQFMDREDGDFRIEPDSPAAGVGDDLGVTMDFTGAMRPNPLGSLPDLGAFEVASPIDTPVLGDINGDGLVNVADLTELATLVAAGTPPPTGVGDMNDDGVVNEADLEPLAQLIVNNP